MPRKKRPIKLFSLDTETYGLGGAIRRIALYDGERIHYGYKFADVECVLDDYYDRGFNNHVYIHNLEFDARKMDGLFERGKIKWGETMIIGGKYAKITSMHYVLHDSFKLLPESLGSISASFDVKHGKMDLEAAIEERYAGQYADKIDFFMRCDADDPLYIEYLGYDVLSLYEVIEKLIEVSGIPLEDFVKRISTASLSRYIFKNGYKGQAFIEAGSEKTDYELLTSCKGWGSKKEIKGAGVSYIDVENMIRESFCGGRTEVFTPRAAHAYHYDVNSLYPSRMIDAEFPIGYPSYESDPQLAQWQWNEWLFRHKGLGYLACTVFVPKQTIPPLPTKKGKLAFMTGHLSGIWSFHELEYAIKKCGAKITAYRSVIYFKRTAKIFRNFIETFSKIKVEAKEAGQRALEKFAKLIMNTSYGFTVLSRDNKTELQDISKIDNPKYQGRILYTDEDLGYIELQSIVTAPSIQAQVGAYVTSYARLVLLDALRTQSKKGIVYYCDTDSIICSTPIDPEHVHNSKLGYWALEREISKGLFLQPKVYTELEVLSPEKTLYAVKKSRGKKDDGSPPTAAEVAQVKLQKKFKGVRHETQKGFDWNFYEEIYYKLCACQLGRVTVETHRALLASLRVAQRRNRDPNYLEYRDKTLDLEGTRKREIDYGRNRSKAWHMESLEQFESFNFHIDYEPYRYEDGSLTNVRP